MVDLHRIFIIWLVPIFLFGEIGGLFAQSEKPVEKLKSKSGKSNAVPHDSSSRVNDYSSENFLLHTDMPADESTKLLGQLEKMLELISEYYGKPNSQLIEMNVVSQINRWPPGSLPPNAIGMIKNQSGTTLNVITVQQNEMGGGQSTITKSVVWAAATRGVAQHEAVHAYCHQNFGNTGPTWYAEGMAELGKYWREDNLGVHVEDYLIEYFKQTEPKKLSDIVSRDQRTGDGWRNYAWRWALCHLLLTNPNYSSRFKPLGMSLLNGQQTRFEDVYGSMSQEISFEYLFFLQHINQGYRCDLCAWDWKTKSQRLRGSATAEASIGANRGWQASRVSVKRGDKLSYSTTGDWSLQKDGPFVGPDGDEAGQGRLLGVLFQGYQLSEPFDLGRSGEYEAASDGNLFVRCRDEWCQLADNTGTVVVKFKTAN